MHFLLLRFLLCQLLSLKANPQEENPMSVQQFARLIAVFSSLLAALAAFGQVTASAPYTVSTFAAGVSGVYFQPDSIALLNSHIFIGYGNGAAKDGSDGNSSTIVEYKMNGDVVKTYSLSDTTTACVVNPHTKRLWALQNEDGKPNLVIIDTTSGTQTVYTFGPTPHGGGYDEIAFPWQRRVLERIESVPQP